MKHTISLTTLCFLHFIRLIGQSAPCDTIITTDGRLLEVSIDKITSQEITYSDCKTKDGNTFAIRVASVKEIRSAQHQLQSAGKAASNAISQRKFSFTLGTTIYSAVADQYEPFVGGDISFDLKMLKIRQSGHLGMSVGFGNYNGLYSAYYGGSSLQFGPKYYVGNDRNTTTVALQYFRFKDCLSSGCYPYRGLSIELGWQLISRSGFVFYPMFTAQKSLNKVLYPGDSESTAMTSIGLRIAIGWAF